MPDFVNFGIAHVETEDEADEIQRAGNNYGVLIVEETGRKRVGNELPADRR
jgi:hypothetical protein